MRVTRTYITLFKSEGVATNLTPFTFTPMNLFQRGFKLREKLATANFGIARPNSLHLLPSTPQIRGLHTFIRNKDTPRDEFIFYSKRLIRLVIEHALTLLPFTVKIDVVTCSYEVFKMFSLW